jgi:acyl-CoA thioesterase YciA
METQSPAPSGKLISQTIAMPRETNANGDIFGGWLLSQMDLAGAILAGRIGKGRVATVAISSMSFLNLWARWWVAMPRPSPWAPARFAF